MNSTSVAIITPSYAADYERCRLLCDSIDRFVEDQPDHYILVDNDDYALFASLAGQRRHIINERDILPGWLRSFRTGFSEKARKVWVSTRTWPMRGWHVQQLRRIAIAHHIGHAGLLYCDSDMLFVRSFSTDLLWQDGNFRLYRNPLGIHDKLPDGGHLHYAWTRHAAKLNGLDEPDFPAHDYINNLVSWRRSDVVGLCKHIERVCDKDWLSAIGSKRSFSECQIFGAYADGVLNGEGVWHGEGPLCQTYWSGEALTRHSAAAFIESLKPEQVAIGVQSFTGTNPAILRALIAA